MNIKKNRNVTRKYNEKYVSSILPPVILSRKKKVRYGRQRAPFMKGGAGDNFWIQGDGRIIRGVPGPQYPEELVLQENQYASIDFRHFFYGINRDRDYSRLIQNIYAVAEPQEQQQIVGVLNQQLSPPLPLIVSGSSIDTVYQASVEAIDVISNSGRGNCYFISIAQALNAHNAIAAIQNPNDKITFFLNGIMYGEGGNYFNQSVVREIAYAPIVNDPHEYIYGNIGPEGGEDPRIDVIQEMNTKFIEEAIGLVRIHGPIQMVVLQNIANGILLRDDPDLEAQRKLFIVTTLKDPSSMEFITDNFSIKKPPSSLSLFNKVKLNPAVAGFDVTGLERLRIYLQDPANIYTIFQPVDVKNPVEFKNYYMQQECWADQTIMRTMNEQLKLNPIVINHRDPGKFFFTYFNFDEDYKDHKFLFLYFRDAHYELINFKYKNGWKMIFPPMSIPTDICVPLPILFFIFGDQYCRGVGSGPQYKLSYMQLFLRNLLKLTNDNVPAALNELAKLFNDTLDQRYRTSFEQAIAALPPIATSEAASSPLGSGIGASVPMEPPSFDRPHGLNEQIPISASVDSFDTTSPSSQNISKLTISQVPSIPGSPRSISEFLAVSSSQQTTPRNTPRTISSSLVASSPSATPRSTPTPVASGSNIPTPNFIFPPLPVEQISSPPVPPVSVQEPTDNNTMGFSPGTTTSKLGTQRQRPNPKNVTQRSREPIIVPPFPTKESLSGLPPSDIPLPTDVEVQTIPSSSIRVAPGYSSVENPLPAPPLRQDTRYNSTMIPIKRIISKKNNFNKLTCEKIAQNITRKTRIPMSAFEGITPEFQETQSFLIKPPSIMRPASVNPEIPQMRIRTSKKVRTGVEVGNFANATGKRRAVLVRKPVRGSSMDMNV